MTLVDAIIDLDAIGMTLDEWKSSMIGQKSYWKARPPQWSDHQRDMLTGWINAGRAFDFTTAGHNTTLLSQPGTYALVWDPKNTATNPILDEHTFVFGEGTQPIWKRIYSNAAALRGVKSNMTDKWATYIDVVCREFKIKRLDSNFITIFYRPHCVTDPLYSTERDHSQEMETQAHAMYQMIHGHSTVANTRDLPKRKHLKKAKKFLENAGYVCKTILC